MAAPLISLADAIRYLSQKSPNACPMCGVNSWTIGTDAQNEFCTVIDSGFHRLNETMYKIRLDCLACGFMREHLTGPMQAWLRENASVEGHAE